MRSSYSAVDLSLSGTHRHSGHQRAQRVIGLPLRIGPIKLYVSHQRPQRAVLRGMRQHHQARSPPRRFRWLDHYTTRRWPYQTATRCVIPNSRGEASGRRDSNLRPLVPQSNAPSKRAIRVQTQVILGESVERRGKRRQIGRCWTVVSAAFSATSRATRVMAPNLVGQVPRSGVNWVEFSQRR